ncbi:Imm1 family immunity protein [Streptoalloteichus hindustanus]|uniref:Immunity protein Imm1 n=1 Tax=Streptoalloteichus hindustanus TaxID=2017 RepID=A0A1M5I467_STRHI|nr:Imm1 family immunity protein [Streptoalloteichus hindustanus]SHG23086.1 Immunity protein Imm1 [Streptoalloteichus hindustanus]
MTLHAFDQHTNILITTHEDLMKVLDELSGKAEVAEVGLSLGFTPAPAGNARHQVVIGIGKSGQGFLQYVDDEGIFWTRAEQPEEGVSQYYFPGHPFSAPYEVEVPFDVVRAGLTEYLSTTQRPTCAAWSPDDELEWNVVLLP